MEKPIDRITEAYFGEMGDDFSIKVRERIHWICSQSKGNNILDVGCSQGITSILLAREGKKVLGIDLLDESIEYANEFLKNESEITKRYVEFKVASFIDYDFKDIKFDTIILSEILEHLTDPERFIKKASTLIKEDSQIIITVPFGINDYFDHKKTYYLIDLIKEITPFLDITEIKFFGKWIGVVTTRKDKEFSLNYKLISEMEKTFYGIERSLLKNISEKEDSIKILKEKNMKLLSDLREFNTNDETINLQKQKMIELKNTNDILENTLQIMKKENEEIKKRNLNLMNDLKNSIEQITSYLDNEKQYLNFIEQKNTRISYLEQRVIKFQNRLYIVQEQRDKINKELRALKYSKLGRLTRKYWKIRRMFLKR